MTGTSFPSQALIEHWNGTSWSQLPSPADTTESLTSLGVTGSATNLTVVGDRESGTAPYTTEVASGSPSSLSLVSTPNIRGDENDLFGATTAPDGSVYAVGWAADPSTGNYSSLIEHEVSGQWSIETTPDPGTSANGFAGPPVSQAAVSGQSAPMPTRATTPPSSLTTAKPRWPCTGPEHRAVPAGYPGGRS